MADKGLKSDAVYHACDPDTFSFDTTAELEPLAEMSEALGQPRAVDSLHFGTGMQHLGYNIYALGQPGTGRHTMVKQILDEKSKDAAVPYEPCYVNNFDDSGKPGVIHMPAGQGKSFSNDVENTVLESRNALKASFESEEYQNRVHSVQQEFKDQEQKVFEDLNAKAKEKGLTLIRTPNGIAFAPVKEDGEVLSPDEYKQLPEEKREEIDKKVKEAQDESQKVFQKIPQLQKKNREQLEKLNQEVAHYSISPLFDDLQNRYGGIEKVNDHLEAVKKDILSNLKTFLSGGQEGRGGGGLMAQIQQQQQAIPGEGEIDINSQALRRYKVNLLVDHNESQGAPVVFEDNPTYANLVGKVEHMSQMGTLTTDFNLIKPGALHQANG